MAKQSSSYVIVTVLTITAACASLYVGQRQPSVSFNARLEALPLKIGNWAGKNLELDKATKDALAADRVLTREYINPRTQEALGLLIVYRKYGRRGFAHRPELCYPASGWEIVRKGYTTLPYAARDTPARLVVAQKDTNRDVITYWFASGRRTEANFVKQQAWMALDRLQPQKYGWAFIRINVPVWYDDEQALSTIRSFMKTAQGPLLKVLTEGD